MEREAVLAVLADAELDDGEKAQRILAINSEDIAQIHGETERLKAELEALRAALEKTAVGEGDGKPDGEENEELLSIKRERDALATEKKERELEERFAAVAQGRKFKNEFTKNGVRELFISAVERENEAPSEEEPVEEEGRVRSDEEIFSQIIKGRENELFELPISIRMYPHSPNSEAPNEIDEIVARKYKGNPWIK